MFSLDLLATLLFEGEYLLEVNTNPRLAVHTMQAAYDAYTSLSSTTPELQAIGLADDAENLGARALILLCWAQLTACLEWGRNLNAVDSLGGVDGVSNESILKCVHALQKHSTRTADSVAVHFLAHQALQQAGRMQEAETALLKLVTHESASAEICAFAIKSALLVPGGAESARAALAAAQDLTSTDDMSLVVELIEAVLGPSNGTTSATAAPPTAADEVILDLLEDEALKEALEQDHERMKNLYTLCWNKGCSLLEAGAPELATKFYVASLLFVDPETDLEIVTQIHMALAVCFSALGDHAKALERLKECPDGCLEAQFCKFSTCLSAKDAEAASAALHSLAAHPDCDATMLRLICCESLDAGLPSAAKESLCLLLQKLNCSEKGKDGSPENVNGTKDSSRNIPAKYEAMVFQNLIQLELDTLDPRSEPVLQLEGEEMSKTSIEAAKTGATILKAASKNAGHAGPWDQVAKVYEMLVQRIYAVGGVEHFFVQDDCKWRQYEWMMVTAWNAGLDAAKSEQNNDQNASIRLMKCCGQLCAGHPSPTDEILSKQQVRLLFIYLFYFCSFLNLHDEYIQCL
jgi:tetratricopeptide (TPR) repeat protein